MKKEIEVKIPAQKEKTILKEQYVCDICGKSSQNPMSKCILCGKDLCNGTFSKCRLFDPRDYGDYPNKYCPRCYEIKFVKYEKEYQQIEKDYLNALDVLDYKIRRESNERLNIILLIVFSVLLGWQLKGMKDFRLYKYIPLDDVLQEVSTREYDLEKYNCLNFSKDAQVKLKEKGINSSIIIGTNGGKYDHAYLGVWIDPINGEFVQGYNFREVYK
jgi:hypothetical protein